MIYAAMIIAPIIAGLAFYKLLNAIVAKFERSPW